MLALPPTIRFSTCKVATRNKEKLHGFDFNQKQVLDVFLWAIDVTGRSDLMRKVISVILLAFALTSVAIANTDGRLDIGNSEKVLDEDPIQNLDLLDVLVENKDGTADLYIVVSSFLDESDYHESLLRQKIQTYVNEIMSETWTKKHGDGNSTIVVNCTETPHQEIIDLIGHIQTYLEEFKIGLRLEIGLPKRK